MNDNLRRYLSVREVAARAGVSTGLVYGWVSSGRLPYYRLGGKGRRGKIAIDGADLDAFSDRVPGRGGET
jgi:excisionase family DNA binding protein